MGAVATGFTRVPGRGCNRKQVKFAELEGETRRKLDASPKSQGQEREASKSRQIVDRKTIDERKREREMIDDR